MLSPVSLASRDQDGGSSNSHGKLGDCEQSSDNRSKGYESNVSRLIMSGFNN